uniref:Metacaspase-1 n=1 Tax=Lygus hesperus TaxID=30085 RepID=A0A0A9ZEF8_LYGHE
MGNGLVCLSNVIDVVTEKEDLKKAIFSRGRESVMKLSNVNWMELGKNIMHAAGPYVISHIGEVMRPERVNIPQAFKNADDVTGFVPYKAPKYKQGNVKALLIGINYIGTSNELKGCVNDVRQEMATFHKIQFPVKEMAILVDDKSFPNFTALPTRANIIKYIAWLVKGAKAGDVLFMHYSGHGTQTRSTRDKYETKNQVICPCDF